MNARRHCIAGTADRAAVAIAVMAKRPEVGRTKTRLSPPLDPSEAVDLYEAMLRDTILLASSIEDAQLAIAVTPADAVQEFERLSPPEALMMPVEGPDIGACLNVVLTDLLSLGYNAAFAINSDGPSLPRGYLLEAFDLIEAADVVLGPSDDGGYYLIGLKRPQPGVFDGVAWSTNRVTAQTLERASKLGLRVAQLPPWYDVDTADDLHRLQEELERLPAGALPNTRRLGWISRYAGRSTGAQAGGAAPVMGRE